MHILMAGDLPSLEQTLEALRATHPDLIVVGHAFTEGELFRTARIEQPEVILLDWSFRPRLTQEWAAYLSHLSGGARIIAVYASQEALERQRGPG
ncbi:MAG: hypothetical protein U0822_02890 [Anaerolineae bacterium]